MGLSEFWEQIPVKSAPVLQIVGVINCSGERSRPHSLLQRTEAAMATACCLKPPLMMGEQFHDTVHLVALLELSVI